MLFLLNELYEWAVSHISCLYFRPQLPIVVHCYDACCNALNSTVFVTAFSLVLLIFGLKSSPLSSWNAFHECLLGCISGLGVTKAKLVMSYLAICLCLVLSDVVVCILEGGRRL